MEDLFDKFLLSEINGPVDFQCSSASGSPSMNARKKVKSTGQRTRYLMRETIYIDHKISPFIFYCFLHFVSKSGLGKQDILMPDFIVSCLHFPAYFSRDFLNSQTVCPLNKGEHSYKKNGKSWDNLK